MMKTWLKRTLLGVAVSTALLGSRRRLLAKASASTTARRRPSRSPSTRPMMLAHIGKKLNLDANQAAKLKVLGDLLVAQHTPPAAGTPNPHAALIAGNTFDRAGATTADEPARRQDAGQRPGRSSTPFGDFFDSLNATQQAASARRWRPTTTAS